VVIRELHTHLVTLCTAFSKTPLRGRQRWCGEASISDPLLVSLPPVGSDALCFTLEEVCSNSTDEYSGYSAQANMAGPSCFTCACEATEDLVGRTQYWAGRKCERKHLDNASPWRRYRSADLSSAREFIDKMKR
jgi:hypothetical protein